MAYEVYIDTGTTTYTLPAPAYPDGYHETVDRKAAMRELANGSFVSQDIASINREIVIYDFKWVGLNSTQMATVRNAFQACAAAACTLTSPTGEIATVMRNPDSKTLRKRVYKLHGQIAFDAEMSLRTL